MLTANNKKIIVRIKGGLGNQLFCYAAARRLALVNEAELVIDDVTGFSRDTLYGRSYMLDNFSIPCRKATPAERMEPLEKYHRFLKRQYNRFIPFDRRTYIEQEGIDFDHRLLDFRVTGSVYLDGLWQGEGYFKDVKQVIRKDLRIIYVPAPSDNVLADRINQECSVAVHIRFFDEPDKSHSPYNLTTEYYLKAFSVTRELCGKPHFIIFSDRPAEARRMMEFDQESMEFADGGTAIRDLWLMGKCKHFIIANSTFSWWGAWLSEAPNKQIFYPNVQSLSGVQGWGFKGLIPEGWVGI